MNKSTKTHFKVAIVGAGPAGSTCAYWLGKNKIKTVLFDDSHPREKPCGGAIPRKLIDEFNIPEQITESKNDWLILESPSGKLIKIKAKRSSYFVMRKKFDGYLLNLAKKYATHKKERVIDVKKDKHGWKILTSNRSYTSEILIGADGANSLVRKEIIGPIPRKHMAMCVGYHIPHTYKEIKQKFKNALEIYFGGLPMPGYIWVFPKRNYVTVGVGLELEKSKNAKQIMDQFLKDHPMGRRVLPPLPKHFYAHILPFISDPKFYDEKVVGENWALIGDAAGHVNPFNGEGIYYAMKGGKLVAEAIVNGNLKSYGRSWRISFGDDMVLGAKLHKYLYTKWILEFLLKLSKKSKSMQNLIVDLILTRRPYREILARKNIVKTLLSAFAEQFR